MRLDINARVICLDTLGLQKEVEVEIRGVTEQNTHVHFVELKHLPRHCSRLAFLLRLSSFQGTDPLSYQRQLLICGLELLKHELELRHFLVDEIPQLGRVLLHLLGQTA